MKSNFSNFVETLKIIHPLSTGILSILLFTFSFWFGLISSLPAAGEEDGCSVPIYDYKLFCS